MSLHGSGSLLSNPFFPKFSYCTDLKHLWNQYRPINFLSDFSPVSSCSIDKAPSGWIWCQMVYKAYSWTGTRAHRWSESYLFSCLNLLRSQGTRLSNVKNFSYWIFKILLLGNNLFELRHQGSLIFITVRKVAFSIDENWPSAVFLLLFSFLKSIL